MPSVTSTGVGSGLDVNNIVSSLMALERRPLQLLQTRASQVQTRLSAYGALQGQLAGLGDVAARLADPAAWRAMRVDSSASEAVTATAVTTAGAAAAAPGRLQLEVQQLAQGQVLASPAFAGSAAVVGTGELRLELGTRGASGFEPRAGGPLRITIDATRQSLAGVRDAINAAQSDVRAAIVGSGAQARLVLRGPEGAASAFRLTAQDDDGQPTDAAGLSALAWDPDAAPGAGRQLTELQAARDAKFTVDGLPQTSPRNQVEGAIEGLALTLRQVTTAPVVLDISVDQTALRKNVDDFTAAYNALVRMLQTQTQADPSGKNRGPLQGDSTPLSLLSQLREMARGLVAGDGSAPAGLSALGLEVQRDGTLSAQAGTLGAALAQPASLARVFAAAVPANDPAGGGLALRLKAWARRATGEDGSLAARMQGLRGTIDSNQKAQDQAQDRLARTEARLRAQYQRLDSDMSSLNARMAQMRSSLGLGNSG